jgi:hypothetical protein
MCERRRIEGGRGPLKAGGSRPVRSALGRGSEDRQLRSKGSGCSDEPAGELGNTVLPLLLRIGQDLLDVEKESGFTPPATRSSLRPDRVPLICPLDQCPCRRLVIIGGIHIGKAERGFLVSPGVLVHKGS